MKFTGFVYAITFLVTGIMFIVMPGILFAVLNAVSITLLPALPMASDSGKFWISLTISMMATITVLSFMIYQDVRRNYIMAVPLVTAKFTSSLFGLGFFIAGCAADTGWNTLANLIIPVTDFPLGLWMLFWYRSVKKERT